MRRNVSLLLGTVFVLFGVFGFPIIYYLALIQRPAVMQRVVDPEILYALGVPGVIIELEKERQIRALDGTVLELDRRDLNFILQSSFVVDDVARKSREIHQSIITHVRQGPRDTFSFTISTAAERPIVQEHLIKYYRRKMVARQECSMGQFLGIAWREVRKVFGSQPLSDEEQLRRLPDCRPPQMVQNAVMNAVAKRLEAARQESDNTLRVVPAFGTKAHRFVRRSLQLGQTGVYFILVLPALLAAITVLSWRDRKACYARVAAPMLITALLLLLIYIPLAFYASELDLFATIHKIDPDFAMSESTAQWLQVVFYVLKSHAPVASYHLALGAAFLLVAGLIAIRQHQRCRVSEAHGPKLTPIPRND